MKQRTKTFCLALIVAALLLIAASTTRSEAQTGGAYDLSWNSIDGGGVTFATGGVYSLGGTSGQPDAGLLTGGSYALLGGFWGAANTAGSLYLPLIVR